MAVQISVVIPTRDREALLHEAIQSVIEQTHQAKEIVIVDDASTEAISQQKLRDKYGTSIFVVRNEKSRGLAWARFCGVNVCTAKYVTHLDDDDLYDKKFLEESLAVFNKKPELEMLFVGVTGFGAFGGNFNKNQLATLEGVHSLMGEKNQSAELYTYERGLFPILLRKVPMVFQRVVTKLKTWKAVSALRLKAYSEINHVACDSKVFDYLGGPLRDSEWSIYAAAYCQNSALLNKPLYFQRCDGQGYSSKKDQASLHVTQGVKIKSMLFAASSEIDELIPWKKEIKKSVATTFFDAAYYWQTANENKKARSLWFQSIKVHLKIKHLKLGVKLFFLKRA